MADCRDDGSRVMLVEILEGADWFKRVLLDWCYLFSVRKSGCIHCFQGLNQVVVGGCVGTLKLRTEVPMVIIGAGELCCDYDFLASSAPARALKYQGKTRSKLRSLSIYL